ncbi:MAG TPA: hypothetical protein GXX19_10850 [Syntrophomonadaceae bacterium]|nr:hypothetical protein [Syntrophomonadaceae bacterium]
MDHQGEKQTAQLRPEMYYEEEIDLRDLLLVLWRYRKMILGIFLAAVIAAAVLSFVLPPVYQVKAVISLGNISGNTGQPTTVISPAVAKEMLQSGDLFREAVESAGLDLSDPLIRSCKEGLKAEPVKDTNLIQVTMETRDPAKGREILDKMVAIFARKGGEGFNKQRELTESELKRVKADLADVDKNISSTKDALTALAGTANGLTVEMQRARLLDALSRFQDQREKLLDKKLSLEQSLNSSQGIEVIEKPAIPTVPVRPRKKLNIAVAGVLGLMVGVFAAFTLDYFRRNPLNCSEACA